MTERGSRQRYLVTGGAGFVGSALCRRLLDDGHEVVAVDNMSNGKESNIPPGIRFVRGDLAEAGTYDALGPERFDAIMHIAAQASNAISFRDPVRDLLDNQLATLRLLEYARHIRCRRVLFTSSMSAYGRPSQFPTSESTQLHADSPYGVHKAASEEYLRVYAQEYGLEWTTFRLYTTYGSTQNLDNLDQGLLSIYLAYLLKNQPIVVKGALERKRDIVHVSDVVEAIVKSIGTVAAHGKTYNMCSGVSLSIREILDALIREYGADPATYPVNVLPGTPGDPPVTHGSFAAAEQDLGWQPKVHPLHGIAMTVAQLRARK